MFKLNSNPFFAPVTEIPPVGGNMDKDDVIKFLGDDDVDGPIDLDKDDSKAKPDSKDKDKAKEKDDDDLEKSDNEDDEDIDELEEIEESLEEVDDEKLELVTPVSRRAILKKYPELFKDFPYLEKAYFREQQFTEIFAHPDDAREAQAKSETLDKFEQDLFEGNTETLLAAVKAETPKAFAKMVDNYLPTLAKVDKDAYHHVIGNTIKQTIIAMVQEGRKVNNEALGAAATILNQFVFGTSDFEAPKNLAVDTKPEVNKEEEAFRKERQDFIRQKFDETQTALNTRVNNSLKATIEANMDPRGSMTDYVKRNAVRDAMENIEQLIEKDSRFKTIVDKLWEKAYKENFSRNSVDMIRSAYLSKAKTLLDPVIKKSRNEALKGMGKRTADVDDKDKQQPEKGQRRKSDDEPPSRKSSGKSKDVPKGMSTLEFLMSED